MEGLTRFVLRHRWLVLGAWAIVFSVCGLASTQLADLLTNRFTLPGTDTHRAERILEEHFGQRTTGAFTVVVRGRRKRGVPRARRRGARPNGQLRSFPPAGSCRSLPVSDDVVVAQIVSNLEPADSKGRTDEMREAWERSPARRSTSPARPRSSTTSTPCSRRTCSRGELIAVPIALLILIFTFGTLAFLLPFAFTIVTIPTTLGIIWVFANFMELTTYLTNLVTLIGLGIAIDYSLLIVYRYREELRRGSPRDEAIVTTMLTAGRAVVFSGTAVALGLALLLFMPLPFIRGFGVGGLVIPAVSVLAAVTFLPVVLSLVGKPLDRVRLLPKRLARAASRPRSAASGRCSHASSCATRSSSPATTCGVPHPAHPARPRARARPRVERGDSARARGRAGLGDRERRRRRGSDRADRDRHRSPEPRRRRRRAGRSRGSRRARPAARGRPRGRRRSDFELTPQHVDATRRYLSIEVVGVNDYGDPASLAVRRAAARRDHPGRGLSRRPRSCTRAAGRPRARTSST